MQTNRSNMGALIAGTILIIFGVLSLMPRVFPMIPWGSLWPVAIIALGSLFFIAMIAGGKQSAAFAIPGSIISGIGLILLFQNITGHWESMSYFWALIIMFVGVGIYTMGWYGGDPTQKAAGARVMKVGFILFIIFGIFFEMLFSSFNNLLFPIALILFGGYLIIGRTGILNRKKIEEPSDQQIPPAS